MLCTAFANFTVKYGISVHYMFKKVNLFDYFLTVKCVTDAKYVEKHRDRSSGREMLYHKSEGL